MPSEPSPFDPAVPAAPESDASLLARIAAGDRPAAARLVDRHKTSVFRFARALVRDAALAEDVLQETFLAALRGAGTFRGDTSARGWLFTIARHAAVRLRPREQPLEDDADVEALGAAAGWGADDPERLVSDGQSRTAVTRALDALDPEDREVLVLRDMEGLTGPEAADVLHVGLPALKSRLHRARLRFVAALRATSGDRSGALDLPGCPAEEAPMKPADRPAENRLVAGLHCFDVLDRLSAFVDGELPPSEVARVRAHVAACTTCERFGGRFAAAVTRLRDTPDPPLAPDVDARLAEKLGLLP